jgi:long-chain acyl-CoA synthetase
VSVVRGEALAVAPDQLPRSVVELVHRSVERDPAHEALRWKTAHGWASWTYAEMWDRIAAVSIGLRDAGLRSGDRVVILSRSRPEWLIADLACQALGAVPCPLYPGDPPARMAGIVRAVDPSFFLVEDAKLLQRLESGMDLRALPGPVVLFDLADGGAGLRSLATLFGPDALRRTAAGTAARGAWDQDWRSLSPTQVSTIVHTIGTDGVPLPVVVAHGNLVHSFHAIVQAIPITSADTVLSVLPMSHMFERGAGILAPIGVGGTVAFAERQIERWATDRAEVRPTLMASIPLFFERVEHRVATELGRGPGFRRALFGWAARMGQLHYENHLAGLTDGTWLRFQRWLAARTVTAPLRRAMGGRMRYLLSGGAALPESTGLFFEALGIPILEGYGLTETAPILTANRPDSYRYGSVGPPVAGTELRIDPATGEIQARGPQIMLGYLDRPSATARAIDADGWLRTGDIGEFDDAGRLHITGRQKNLLVLATGKNVAPAPIERAVESSPYVRQAVLLGDGRDATGILLVPDLEAIRGATSVGDAVASADVLADPAVAALLRQEVERLTAEFASYERPRRSVPLSRPLSVDRGEVDLDGRPVRAVVVAQFPSEVAELFDRAGRDPRRPAGERPSPEGSADRRPEPSVSAPG